MLYRHDRWIWDSWPIDDGDDHHLFYLQAPRTLGDPDLRHRHASIGHAVSKDYERWIVLPDALGPSGPPAWDDLATWTGSVVRGDTGSWHLFYTAISRTDDGRIQRIGRADSDDLITWRRSADRPLLEADPRWYETCELMSWREVAWRDPWVFRDPGGDGWHMLITARAVGAARNDDGVVAHARSHDLMSWTIEEPLCRPGAGFGQLEVPQSKVIDGRPVLVFTCHPEEQTAARRAGSGDYCTWSVPSPGVLGPWDIAAARPFTAEPDLFAAPLVRRRDGGWAFVGFRNLEPKVGDGFYIVDPIPVTVDEAGYVVAAC